MQDANEPNSKSTSYSPAGVSGNLVLGDIVVCYPIAQQESNRDNMLVDDKINELISHGLLHLLGEHHES
jgi:probable rRNA maturation factor